MHFLVVVTEFIFAGEAVVTTEFATDDIAGKPWRILAMMVSAMSEDVTLTFVGVFAVGHVAFPYLTTIAKVRFKMSEDVRGNRAKVTTAGEVQAVASIRLRLPRAMSPNSHALDLGLASSMPFNIDLVRDVNHILMWSW